MECVINKYDAMGESRDYYSARQKFDKAREVCQ
jgi:hypothetical protein